jgi:hypothetical protein
MAERGAPADPSGDLSACVAPTGIQGRGRGSVSLRDGEPNLPLSGPRAHTIMGSSMLVLCVMTGTFRRAVPVATLGHGGVSRCGRHEGAQSLPLSILEWTRRTTN